MATYQKRGKAWRALVRRNGHTETKTFDLKSDAVAWATAVEASLMSGAQPVMARPTGLGDEPTVRDMMQRYADETSPSKRGASWEVRRIKALLRDFPVFDNKVSDFNAKLLAEWRDSRLHDVSKSSVRRDIELLSSIFSLAIKEWGYGITVNPCSLVKKPAANKPRTQRVSPEDKAKILSGLDWDGKTSPKTTRQWTAYAFCLALETAMRKSEILSLTWGDVHLDSRYVHLDMTKNGESRDVPLSKAAISLLSITRRSEPSAYVVPVKSWNIDAAFRRAKNAVGLNSLHFHDTRREAATTMAPKLSNVLELAAITGHKSISMLQVYYKPKPADIAKKLD